MIHLQEGQTQGVTKMFNLIAAEAAVREREREIQEAVRRRRLLAGDGPDPELEIAAASARIEHREHRSHPLPVVAP